MDKKKFFDLFESSKDIKIGDEYLTCINESTLSECALKYIECIIRHQKPKNVLEFGSGLSTRFFDSILCDVPGSKIVSVNHSLGYLNETKKTINSNKVQLVFSPLKKYHFFNKVFLTYDSNYLNNFLSESRIDFVLIDGPPAYQYGREAPLYQIASFLHNESIIILDDANREPEQSALKNWMNVWGNRISIIQFPEVKKGLAVIQINNPSQFERSPFSLGDVVANRFQMLKKRVKR